ncbi:FAD-dependent oxidoreductase [Vannielia litorea]|uniref:FAD-dependent oxidoreductase n=1 Tax=Vannielia litorea TaxID=1217970 RepID=UPI001C948189|nr:FAD-dependent oxidoreductase [Vannielia litorea]MBY6046995.1 FAD-dependent monooxygenase [Vannielia litorea]MBY6074409.1 FAD-dependent monooxygenase [Vannielia litorea]
MTLIGLDVLVLGGGVAGLATARALALRGARVRLLEQAGEIAEVGAGLQVSPNAGRVLEALGLGPDFAEVSDESRGVRMREAARGQEVAFVPYAGRGRFANVHRADLIAVLERGAREAGVEITLGCRAAEVQPGGRVITAAGKALEAGLVVGADGLHSVARAALLGAQEPVFTHQVAWRALVEAEVPLPPEAQLFLAPGRHLVAYPLRGGRLVNIVACEEQAEWAEEGWQVPGDVEVFRAAFAGFGGPVPGWLARVETVRRWGLFRHGVAARWNRERLVIVGDAAHPTLPYLAQGAAMGLEDAWVLAASLAEADGLEAGLAAFQAAREARCRRIVDAATANARNYHLPRGPKRWAAHLALGLASRFAPGILPGRFDWLWGEDVTAG